MSADWYPGNMEKTKKIIRENLKVVDVVIEVLDARIPRSSQNPKIDSLIRGKQRMIVLNKKDLADDEITQRWIEMFMGEGIKTSAVNSITGEGIDVLLEHLAGVSKKKPYRSGLRLMILGIPNVGKSTLINRLVGRRITRVGNKPGITRGKQWINVKKSIRILDTPGVLWPNLQDKEVKIKLALVKGIKEEILDPVDLAFYLVRFIKNVKHQVFEERFGIASTDEELEILKAIGKKRGCLLPGGKIDLTRTSNTVLDEFRKGKLGGLSLEKP